MPLVPRRVLAAVVLSLAASVVTPHPAAQTGSATAVAGQPLFDEADLRSWLTTLSSDLMQGRAVFTEG